MQHNCSTPNAIPSSDAVRRTMAAVRPYHGAPTLFINGAPHAGMVYMTYGPDQRYFAQFAKAGVHLYSFSATPTDSAYGLSPICWIAPDTFDDTPFEERVRMILDADPQAYLLPRLYLGSPHWWDDRHPDDLLTCDHG